MDNEFTLLTLPYQYKTMFLFLLVFYLAFSFFPPQIQVPNFFTRYINGKFQLSLQKETKINPHNKCFGLNQIFNSDREHTSSYSKHGVLPPKVQTRDMQHQVTGLSMRELV